MTEWERITAEVNGYGCALTSRLLTPTQTEEIIALYDSAEHFRSTIDMARYRFGRGQYRYFRRPYPEAIEALKQALYPRLLPIARDWHDKLNRPAPWPDTLDEWLDICRSAGRRSPRPSC